LKNMTFYSSLFFSRLADQLLLFLLPLVIYQLTGDASLSGLAFFFETLPRFIAFPICGILSDHFSAYKLLRNSQLARFIIVLLAVAGFYAVPSITWLVVTAAIVGVLTTQAVMAREMLIATEFTQYRFERVLAHTQLADQLAMVGGPLLAALLLSVIPWQHVLLVTSLLFLFADICLKLWKLSYKPKLLAVNQRPVQLLASLQVAGRQVIRLPRLFAAIGLAFSVNLILGALLATSVAIYTGAFAQSQSDYALLQSLAAISTVVILLCLARWSLSLTMLGVLGFVAICTGGLLSSVTDSALLYLLGFLLVVSFDKMFNIFVRSLRRQIIPQQDFGKTSGLIVLLNNIPQPLAGLAVALLANSLGVQQVLLLLVSCAALIGLAVFMVMARQGSISFAVPEVINSRK